MSTLLKLHVDMCQRISTCDPYRIMSHKIFSRFLKVTFDDRSAPLHSSKTDQSCSFDAHVIASLLMKSVSRSPALTRKIRHASKEDSDLFTQDLQESERHCFRRHSRRVWERLGKAQRESIRKQVIAENAKNEFLPTDATHQEYECIRVVQRMIEEK